MRIIGIYPHRNNTVHMERIQAPENKDTKTVSLFSFKSPTDITYGDDCVPPTV